MERLKGGKNSKNYRLTFPLECDIIKSERRLSNDNLYD